MITLLLASTMMLLEGLELAIFPHTFACYTSLILLILTVSYAIITVKIKSNPHPQHFSVVASERKLSATLSIVTVVSILTIPPLSIWMAIEDHILSQMSLATNFHTVETLMLLHYANSIVNPLIYAIRM